MAYTSDVDWPIHEKLDEADNFIVEDPPKAIELFEKILQDHPKSPRAQYALIR